MEPKTEKGIPTQAKPTGPATSDTKNAAKVSSSGAPVQPTRKNRPARPPTKKEAAALKAKRDAIKPRAIRRKRAASPNVAQSAPKKPKKDVFRLLYMPTELQHLVVKPVSVWFPEVVYHSSNDHCNSCRIPTCSTCL